MLGSRDRDFIDHAQGIARWLVDVQIVRISDPGKMAELLLAAAAYVNAATAVRQLEQRIREYEERRKE